MASDEAPRFGRRPLPNAIDKRIGEEVRKSRLDARISQEQLGSQVGISCQQIHKYEKGTNKISAARLQEIAAALGLPINHFYDAIAHVSHRPGKPHQASERRAFTSQDIRLVEAFNRIGDPMLRKLIFDFLIKLSEQSTGMN